VSDIFREVDEEVRRERLKKLWDRYQFLVIGGALLIVIGVGGWRGYQWMEARKAAAAGTTFENAITLGEAEKHAEAAAALAAIAKEGTPAYRDLASLRRASELAAHPAELSADDAKTAVAAYKEVAADTSIAPSLRELATLRAAALQINQREFDDVRKQLEPMAEPGRNYRHAARELLAFAAWHAGDTAALQRWIGVIAKDPETPLGTRSRIEVLAALSAVQSKT
jgi:hypothetical protein